MASTAIRIGPADHGRAMTWQQFQDAEEEPGYLYELVRGVLEVTEVPGDPMPRWLTTSTAHSTATGTATPR